MKNEKDFFRIGRVRISITNEDDAVQYIKDAVYHKQKGYICISNMRTVAIANKNDAYQDVMENSLMNTPDGTPLVWCGRCWGLKRVGRACGPHVFSRVLKENDRALKHFFLGDTEETLNLLCKKVKDEYGAMVAGSFSPPFCSLEEYDVSGMAKIINKSGASIVWISLRAPKQDFLSAKIAPLLNRGIILVGVGAAFRTEIGNMKQPDGFIQKIGLAGLIFKRANSSWWTEIKWYAVHVLHLMKYIFTILCKRVMCIKYYE